MRTILQYLFQFLRWVFGWLVCFFLWVEKTFKKWWPIRQVPLYYNEVLVDVEFWRYYDIHYNPSIEITIQGDQNLYHVFSSGPKKTVVYKIFHSYGLDSGSSSTSFSSLSQDLNISVPPTPEIDVIVARYEVPHNKHNQRINTTNMQMEQQLSFVDYCCRRVLDPRTKPKGLWNFGGSSKSGPDMFGDLFADLRRVDIQPVVDRVLNSHMLGKDQPVNVFDQLMYIPLLHVIPEVRNRVDIQYNMDLIVRYCMTRFFPIMSSRMVPGASSSAEARSTKQLASKIQGVFQELWNSTKNRHPLASRNNGYAVRFMTEGQTTLNTITECFNARWNHIDSLEANIQKVFDVNDFSDEAECEKKMRDHRQHRYQPNTLSDNITEEMWVDLTKDVFGVMIPVRNNINTENQWHKHRYEYDFIRDRLERFIGAKSKEGSKLSGVSDSDYYEYIIHTDFHTFLIDNLCLFEEVDEAFRLLKAPRKTRIPFMGSDELTDCYIDHISNFWIGIYNHKRESKDVMSTTKDKKHEDTQTSSTRKFLLETECNKMTKVGSLMRPSVRMMFTDLVPRRGYAPNAFHGRHRFKFFPNDKAIFLERINQIITHHAHKRVYDIMLVTKMMLHLCVSHSTSPTSDADHKLRSHLKGLFRRWTKYDILSKLLHDVVISLHTHFNLFHTTEDSNITQVFISNVNMLFIELFKSDRRMVDLPIGNLHGPFKTSTYKVQGFRYFPMEMRSVMLYDVFRYLFQENRSSSNAFFAGKGPPTSYLKDDIQTLLNKEHIYSELVDTMVNMQVAQIHPNAQNNNGGLEYFDMPFEPQCQIEDQMIICIKSIFQSIEESGYGCNLAVKQHLKEGRSHTSKRSDTLSNLDPRNHVQLSIILLALYEYLEDFIFPAVHCEGNPQDLLNPK